MTALNKQVLREAVNAANIASWGKWESYKPHKGARGYEVKVGAKAVAQHCLKVDSAFIATANPSAVLTLLDELEAAEKRIAELTGKPASEYADDADLLFEIDFCDDLSTSIQVAQWLKELRIRRVAGIGVKGE